MMVNYHHWVIQFWWLAFIDTIGNEHELELITMGDVLSG